ncbi:MAG: VOC family protein, partial [Bryobacteraceae bacterium]
FTVPRGSLAHWIERADRARVEWIGPEMRFGEEWIELRDPAGLAIELIASGPEDAVPAIPRLHSATLQEADPDSTARFLTETMGCGFVSSERGRMRFDIAGTPLDLIKSPAAEPAKLSAGMPHHLAFRVGDEAAQNVWREKLTASGIRVTRTIDRQYFRSMYFREPGGVLFEIATDGPGFLLDESQEELGRSLKLPPWLEKMRENIERRLPEIHAGASQPPEAARK